MIIQMLVSIFLGIMTLMLDVLPDLPDMPSVIITGGDWAVDMVSGFIGFFDMLLGHTLLVALFGTVILLMSWEYVYWTVLWSLKKIPFINIK